MSSDQQTDIDSFMIRFVRMTGAARPIRGSIRHLQSNENRAFSCWQDVENFIRRFVPLDGARPDDSEPAGERPDPR